MARRAPFGNTASARCLPAAGSLAVLLSGCVAGGAPQPSSQAVPGDYQVSVEGAAFWAELRPGAAGVELTAAGARPVAGHEIMIRNATGFAPLGPDAGAVTKKAARLACAEAGGRFNETALGRHEAGRWYFAGACA